MKYYLAAQGLIWDAIVKPPSGWNVYYQYQNTGATIDISAQIAEIEALIANYETRPSFNGESYNLELGETKTIIDTKKTLNRFEVASCSNCTASISGNNLTFTPTGIGNLFISLQTKKTYTKDTEYFVSGAYQNLILPGNVDPVYVSLSGSVNGGTFKLKKTNKQTGNALENIEFEVYNSEGNKVCTIKTNENGEG